MTSINFNSAATTALRTLQQTNSALETSQNRVSTGLKIGEAKDNAAYWSISTTLKSDNKALSTVKDALGLGAATVDTAYQGLNKTLEVLDEIKTKLTAATQDGVSKTKIQSEISELQEQLKSIATSSTFSGENWLSTNGLKTSAEVVASFTRNSDSAVSIGTINVDLSSVALVVTNDSSKGILSAETTANAVGFTKVSAATVSYGAANSTTDGDKITAGSLAFTVSIVGGASINVTLDTNTQTNASVTSIESDADLAKLLNQALADAKVSGVTASVTNKQITWSGNKGFTISAATASTAPASNLTPTNFGLNTQIVADASANASYKASVLNMDISAASSSQIQAYIDIVSKAADKVTNAASTLGAISSRIELQTSFVSTLMDTIDKGVSGLVDADLSEESTRLQALQTKQQLGIQALSIANTSTQNILSLFRS